MKGMFQEELEKIKRLVTLNTKLRGSVDSDDGHTYKGTKDDSRSQRFAEESNRLYYNKYGKYYEEYHAYFRNEVLIRRWENNLTQVKAALPVGENIKAIDFGCGTGLLSLMLLNLGCSVTAIDVSDGILSEFKKKVNELPNHLSERVCCLQGGIELLTSLPSNNFHIVCASSVMHHLDNYLSFLHISNKLLVPQGVIYIGREPLIIKEQRVHTINLPLYMMICAVDVVLDKFMSKGKAKEVFNDSIQPQLKKGGVSCKDFIEIGKELGFEVLLQRTYNWHRSSLAYTIDNVLPRFLRFERVWGTFFDLALQKQIY
jgi:2-polyprenyl-3-methyl-5-hydroxy-6-metoxy-1,4-benzoquinol methylase